MVKEFSRLMMVERLAAEAQLYGAESASLYVHDAPLPRVDERYGTEMVYSNASHSLNPSVTKEASP